MSLQLLNALQRAYAWSDRCCGPNTIAHKPIYSHHTQWNNHSYISIHILRLHVLTLTRVFGNSLPVILLVTCYFSLLLHMFLCLYFHTHKYGGVLRYTTKYAPHEIPSSNIPSIFSLLIFYHYFFLPLVFISKFKIITAPK